MIFGIVLLLSLCGAASAETLQPGNYCASCHVATDPVLDKLAEWQARPPEEATCPAVKAYREELLYTEQLLTATERAGTFAGNQAVAPQEKRLGAFRQGYDALRQAPLTSLDAFTSQAQTLRFQGNKVYTAYNGAIDVGKRNWVLLFAALVTLFVIGSLAWGLRNTLKFRPAARTWWREWRPGWRTAAAIGLVFVLFALPIFRVPAAAVETPTVEEQAVQTTLDTSGRVADTADRALACAWMLARVGAAWSPLDPAQGEAALDAALVAADEARAYADALWGQAQAAEEAGIGSAADQEKAALVAAQLEAVRNRAWGLRLIAAEWAAVDRARAAEIMAQAQALAETNRTPYGQLDLTAIVAERPRLDPSGAAAAPYALRTDRIIPTLSDVPAARERLLALPTEAEKAEVLRYIAAQTGAQADFDAALAMALAARVRGDALAPAEASLALAKAMLPVDKAMGRAAFAQALDVAQKIVVKYK